MFTAIPALMFSMLAPLTKFEPVTITSMVCPRNPVVGEIVATCGTGLTPKVAVIVWLPVTFENAYASTCPTEEVST